MSKATIEGYLNFTATQSRRMFANGAGNYVEIIENGAFSFSLDNYDKPIMTINHDESKIIAQGEDLELKEDEMGLKFKIKTDNTDVISRVLNNKFKGTSFKFKPLRQSFSDVTEANHKRHIDKSRLLEVTLITDDSNLKPAYKLFTIRVTYLPGDLRSKVKLAELRAKPVKLNEKNSDVVEIRVY